MEGPKRNNPKEVLKEKRSKLSNITHAAALGVALMGGAQEIKRDIHINDAITLSESEDFSAKDQKKYKEFRKSDEVEDRRWEPMKANDPSAEPGEIATIGELLERVRLLDLEESAKEIPPLTPLAKKAGAADIAKAIERARTDFIKREKAEQEQRERTYKELKTKMERAQKREAGKGKIDVGRPQL